jgi:hypothetical protein
MRAGYLRKSGVPYSAEAVLTEYRRYDGTHDWQSILLTSIIEDPVPNIVHSTERQF